MLSVTEKTFVSSSENVEKMWSLIMGASYSSEEEGGDDMAGGVTKTSVTEEQGDSVTHREEGDGMERPPEAAVISDNNPEDCDNSDKKCDKNVMEAGGEQKLDSDKSNEEANKSVNSVASPTKFIEVYIYI